MILGKLYYKFLKLEAKNHNLNFTTKIIQLNFKTKLTQNS